MAATPTRTTGLGTGCPDSAAATGATALTATTGTASSSRPGRSQLDGVAVDRRGCVDEEEPERSTASFASGASGTGTRSTGTTAPAPCPVGVCAGVAPSAAPAAPAATSVLAPSPGGAGSPVPETAHEHAAVAAAAAGSVGDRSVGAGLPSAARPGTGASIPAEAIHVDGRCRISSWLARLRRPIFTKGREWTNQGVCGAAVPSVASSSRCPH